jgi:hypothetical protein
MHYVAAKFVLCLLSEDQKQNRVDVSTQLVNRVNADENFSNNVKMKAIFAVGLETVTETQKSTASLVHMKVRLCFFDCEGVIHHEFLPCSQTVNKKLLFEGDEKAERCSEEIRA